MINKGDYIKQNGTWYIVEVVLFHALYVKEIAAVPEKTKNQIIDAVDFQDNYSEYTVVVMKK